jgi:hypothetical protein
MQPISLSRVRLVGMGMLNLMPVLNRIAVLKISPVSRLFELGRQARPGRQTGIRLNRSVPAEGQNKSWGHRLTAKAITYQQRYIKQQICISICLTQWYFCIFSNCCNFCLGAPWSSALAALSACVTVPCSSAQTSRWTDRKRFPRVGIHPVQTRVVVGGELNVGLHHVEHHLWDLVVVPAMGSTLTRSLNVETIQMYFSDLGYMLLCKTPILNLSCSLIKSRWEELMVRVSRNTLSDFRPRGTALKPGKFLRKRLLTFSSVTRSPLPPTSLLEFNWFLLLNVVAAAQVHHQLHAYSASSAMNNINVWKYRKTVRVKPSWFLPGATRYLV